MNFNHVLIVLKKELKSIFRDKRTWLASVLIPTMLFPLLFYFMGMGMSKVNQSVNANIKIAVESAQGAEELINYLDSDDVLEVVQVDNSLDALKSGKIKAIVKIEDNFDQKIKSNIPISIRVQYDEASTESSFAYPTVQGAISRYSSQVVNKRLTQLGVDPTILLPINLERETVQYDDKGSHDGAGLMLLTFLLPFLLVLYPMIGGMPVAIDIASGEKERQSLEPLLSTGASRLSILMGKYLTVVFASVLGVVTSLIGLVIATKTSPEMLPSSISISLPSILVMAAVSITMAMILSAILLVLSTLSKSYKEAGTYMSPLMIVLMVPVYMTMFADIKTIPKSMFYIPVMNSVMLIKESLFVINPVNIIVTLSISLCLVAASIYFVKYMFDQEWVIFRS